MTAGSPSLRQIAGPRSAPRDGGAHILVAGTIAAGKSTLTRALAAELRLPEVAERPEANPFLERFYADPRRWALTSQLWFAADSARQHLEIHERGGAIQDHSIYENVHVFGAALAEQGALEESEWSLLRQVTAPIIDSLPPPAIVLLVEAPIDVLMERIAARGRPYEADINRDYLTLLTNTRRRFFETWSASPVLLVDSAAIDLREPSQTETIAAKVRDYLPELV